MSKLVRDNIPEYVHSIRGEVLDTRIAAPAEMLQLLKDKVLEEAKEVFEAQSQVDLLAEIGDLQDVLDAIIERLGNRTLYEELRAKKLAERGGFSKGVVLK